MSRPVFMTIDLAALRHNLHRIKQFAPQSALIAMVKANAYGHGIVPVAQALPLANAFGVASLEEALKLRGAGISQPIVLMEGIFHRDELREAAENQLSLVVHHLSHVELLEKAIVKKPFPVWLKINTGMNRLGVNPEECHSFYQRLTQAPSVLQPIGLMTHFAEANSLESPATLKQIDLFQQTTQLFKGPKSLGNSAAILAWPKTHQDWIRPGVILYGASPFADQTGMDHGLLPVMTLSSRLIAIIDIKKGDKVGYGGTWTAPEDMCVGVAAGGYGDGYPQSAENGTPILVKKKACALAGRVSMDMLTIDLRNARDAQVGDPVTLWGEGLPVETVAKHSQTSVYEILTRMTPRPQIHLKDV